jgi:hypothetical protein
VGPGGNVPFTVDIKFLQKIHAEGQGIARKLGCRFVETSAKLGSNVTETFIDLVCEIRDRNRVGFFFLSRAAFAIFPSVSPIPCPYLFLGNARDAPRFTACHSGQRHPIARCRVLEQGLRPFLIHRGQVRNGTRPRLSIQYAHTRSNIIRLNSVFFDRCLPPPCAFGDWVCTLGRVGTGTPLVMQLIQKMGALWTVMDASVKVPPTCVQYVCCLIYPGSVIVPISQLVDFTREFPWREGDDSVSRFMHTMFP